jgi:hypothetical protein
MDGNENDGIGVSCSQVRMQVPKSGSLDVDQKVMSLIAVSRSRLDGLYL